MVLDNKKKFIGIDQTGAVNKKGEPFLLPLCLIEKNEIQFFYLKSFNKEEILKSTGLSQLTNTLICIDCVLGLPRELNINWRKSLKKIKNNSGYGRQVASQFFREIGGGTDYRREIELKCKANSVFKEKPFQKNIQTGSYRIWKDISNSPKDFHVPFLGEKKRKNSMPIYEGYPSLSWKKIFGLKNRKPEILLTLVKKKFPNLKISNAHQLLLKRDVNLADAMVLALTIMLATKTDLKFKKPFEGWILGFKDNH